MEITNLNGNDHVELNYVFTPCRMLFSGKSGCGKTNVMMNLLLKYMYFDKYFIYSKYLNDKAYQKLIAHFDKINKKMRKKLTNESYSIYIASDNPEDIISNEELKNENPNHKKLIIIDDFFLEKSIKDRVRDLFVSSRHTDTSIFYTAQSYHLTDPIIRENCNYLCLWKTNSKGELTEIGKRMVPELSTQQFTHLFTEVTSIPFSFLCIDTSNYSEIYPKMKLRRNFDEFIDIDEFKKNFDKR